MTKHIIRLVVTVLILSVVGYVGWEFLFKPNNDEKLYDNVLSVAEKIETDEFTKSVNSLLVKTKVGNANSGVAIELSNPLTQQIFRVRELLSGLSSFNLAKNIYGDHLEQSIPSANYKLVQSNQVLNDSFNYYVPHLKFVSGMNGDDVKELKDLIKKYNSSLEQVKIQISEINTYQGNELTNTVSEHLTNYYFQLLGKINNYYVNYSNLVLSVSNYAVNNTTSGEMLYELESVYTLSSVQLINKFASTVGVNEFKTIVSHSLSADPQVVPENVALVQSLNKYHYESLLLMETLKQVKLQINAGVYDGLNVVTIYNKVFAGQPTVLLGNASVILKPFEEKIKIIQSTQNTDEVLANINEKFIQDVKELLKLFGYNENIVLA